MIGLPPNRDFRAVRTIYTVNDTRLPPPLAPPPVVELPADVPVAAATPKPPLPVVFAVPTPVSLGSVPPTPDPDPDPDPGLAPPVPVAALPVWRP
ncbi:hypothetical protein WCLP8_4730001 [uncultured Gammaproteobacteria bacterium]